MIFLPVCACSQIRKIEKVQSGRIAPVLSMSEDIRPEEISLEAPKSDTMKVSDAQGREMIIMKAVKDENGEMVASDVIAPVLVSARFRNVAERHGVVELRFDVKVPAAMLESRWQLRLQPVLTALGDSTRLEPLLITGGLYRKAQLRGYQRYRHFLDGIVSDTSIFVRKGQLEFFLKRNLPLLYALKKDSSFVSDEQFASLYGISEKEAVEHYTDRFRLARNRRREAMREKMFARYVKAPFRSGVRLDTVVMAENGDFIYNYVHSMPAAAGLRKAEIRLGGGLYEEDRRLCALPLSSALSFYVSSLSGLAENRVRYLTRIVERRVQASTACYVEFAPGSWALDTALGNNASEMSRIAGNLEEILGGGKFDIDSIVVQASCSPEGSWLFNKRLSFKRGQAVCTYYSGLSSRDSLHLDFIPREIPENWAGLERLVAEDESISDVQKEEIRRICSVPDPDEREKRLSQLECYKYLRGQIYPRLRVVRFGFHLQRRGMIKDTLHSTIQDSVYMNGVKALRDHDYKMAVSLLRPYRDINTALAFCALDYNASALSVLDSLPDSPKAQYMRALIHARKGEDREAVECYVRACDMDPALVHRGNLDPEISALKNKYKIPSKL